ncbi:hypothetical protein MK385_01590 [Streptococcus oralis]|uniref:hypothetical protein n=1 Tax=Streptococcus oralis TaxID=1303 RepID=UPI0022840EC4|nr:hypothetical protein [Streptococcus oralis]MCY7061467.1 hypothetical protein [Streptococcus oralis]
MGGLKKSLFLGYSRSSVHEVVNELKSQVNELEIRNSQLLRTIEELKDKELFVSEAIVEAKRVSIDIISEAEVQSEQLVNEMKTRIEQSVEELKQLEVTKQDIMNRTEFIKHELKQLLENQITIIDNIDTGGVHHIEHIIDDLLSISREHLDRASRILSLENSTSEDAIQNGKSNVSYLTPENNNVTDLNGPPIFSVGSF